MKICISSTGNKLDSQLDTRFGRSQYFIIMDLESTEYKSIVNEGNMSSHGAGIAAAQQVVSEEVDVVITGSAGPNSMNVLKSSSIKIYRGIGDTIEKNVQLFKENQLDELSKSEKSHTGK